MRPEKAVFVFVKEVLRQKLQSLEFLNLANQIRNLIPKASVQWILAGAIVGQASRLPSKILRSQAKRPHYFPKFSNRKDFGIILDSGQPAFAAFFKFHSERRTTCRVNSYP